MDMSFCDRNAWRHDPESTQHCEIFAAIAPIIGSVAGAALSKSGGGSQTTTTTPWSEAAPYWKDVFGRSDQVVENTLPYYPGNTVAPFNALQQGGMQDALTYAQNGYAPGTNYLQGTLADMMASPNNMMGNPALRAMLGANANQVSDQLLNNWLPAANMGAMAAGQLGGGRHGVAQGTAIKGASQALANANASTMGNFYNAALGQQRAAAAQMPQALSMGFTPSQTALDVGGMQQGMNQQLIADQMARYYYPQTGAREALNWQAGLLNMTSPYSSTTGSSQGSPLAGAMGGAMMGSQLSGLFGAGSSPMTANQMIAAPLSNNPFGGGYSSSAGGGGLSSAQWGAFGF